MIDESVLETVLTEALRSGGDFAEVFAEDRRSSSAQLEDGRVEELTSGRDRGAGIRVVVGSATGFAHTTDLSEAGLRSAAVAASSAARGGGGNAGAVPINRHLAGATHVEVLPETVAKADKVELLRRADEAARAGGGSLRQVAASYSDARRQVLVANSEGLFATDDRVRSRIGVNAVAEGDAGMQTGFEAVAATGGFEVVSGDAPEVVAAAAVRRAVTKLDARPAPSGSMPVVLAAGSGGVLFHEACGHGLEADLVAKGASVFAGRVGERVASEFVTLVDDGTVAGEWGTGAIDDEGQPVARNVLIDRGVLTAYMADRLRSRGGASTGNGRRQSYRHLPMVRMTNTFLLDGEDDPDDIVASTPYGVYVARLGGGSVDTATGDFVFGMTESYLIEDGHITVPLREGNLIGNGPDVLLAIDAVGHDFAMGSGGGMCGKDGQGVPVGLGQPTLRVASLTVGGTAA